MTIKVTSSAIQILNADGTVKFDSSNKLLYKVAYKTGTLSLTGGATFVPFQALKQNDFLVLRLKLNSGTGNADIINPILNTWVPGNSNIIVDFYPRLGAYNYAATDTEILGGALIKDNLVFRSIRFDASSYCGAGTTTNNITYEARILSFL